MEQNVLVKHAESAIPIENSIAKLYLMYTTKGKVLLS